MMRNFTFALAALFWHLVQAECDLPTPIALPIQSVPIGKDLKRRAFGISVGTPSQGIALAINANDGQCAGDLTSEQCRFNRGGLFDDAGSSTYDEPALRTTAEIRPADNGRLTTTIYGADDITLTDNRPLLKNFSFYKPIGGELPQNGLGLGRGSTILQTLFDTGKIASRSWSLFWGLEGKESKDIMDGSIVMGGYDRAKTSGPNSTQPFSTLAEMAKCPSSLIVIMTDIVVKHSNGTNQSLFGGAQGSALRTCIKPDVPLITFPSPIFQNFKDAIGGTYVEASHASKLWGMNYLANDVFDGDLQFTLSSGLELTIPNNQLVVPNLEIDQQGILQEPNSTLRELLVYNYETSNEDDMPLLGQAFLSSTYLHVDNERGQFILWQANPTTEQDLVAIPSTGKQTCPQGSSGNTDQSSPSTSHRRLSAGAIAGIVVGVLLAAAALLGAIALALLRKRRSKNALLDDDASKRHSSVYSTHKEMSTNEYGSEGQYNGLLAQNSGVLGVLPHEADGAEVHELLQAQEAPRYELHDATRYELDGGPRR